MGSTIQISDFIVETNGHCFLCLRKIADQLCQVKVYPATIATTPVYPIQYVGRYLKLGMRNAFSKGVTIPTHLLSKVQRSTLKVELCQECAVINEKFTEVFRQLEKLQMEASYWLKEILAKLKVGEETQKTEALFGGRAQRKIWWIKKLNVVKALRKEMMKNCSNKLRQRIPRVRHPTLHKRQPKATSKLNNQTMSQLQDYSKSRGPNLAGPQDDNNDNDRDSNIRKVIPMGHILKPVMPNNKPVKPNNPNQDLEPHNIVIPLKTSGISIGKAPSQEMLYPEIEIGPIKTDPDFEKSIEDATGSGSCDNDDMNDSTPELAHLSLEASLIKQEFPIPIEASMTSNYSVFNSQTGKFKCRDCPKEFETDKECHEHYMTAHLKIKYKCPMSKITKDEETPQKYSVLLRPSVSAPQAKSEKQTNGSWNRETGKYKCGSCSKEFSNLNSCRTHYNCAHLDDKFECKMCGKKFNHNTSLSRHYKSVHEGLAFKCPNCNKLFTDKSNYINHWRSKHSSVRVHGCEICGRSFKLRWALKVHHRNVHSKLSTSSPEASDILQKLANGFYL